MPHNQDAWDEFCLLQDSSLKIMTLYVTWFIWSLGLNLLVVGALFAKGNEPIPDLVTGMGCLMIFGEVIAVGGGIQQVRYYRKTLKRAGQLAPFVDGSPATELVFARPIALYVCSAVPLVHFTILLGWVLLLRKYGTHPYLLISN
jgi:hypothetical protein